MTHDHRPEGPTNPIFDFRWWLAPLMLALTAFAGAYLLHGERPDSTAAAATTPAVPATPPTTTPGVPPTTDELPEPQPPTF